MAYVLAALGGALGALARWAVAEAIAQSIAQSTAPSGGWPWATMLVNLTGCFLLGVLLDVVGRRSPEPAWAKPFLGVGVLGGYTTYSAFAVEVVELVDDGALALAVGYVLVSVVGGVLGVGAGALGARRVSR